MTSCNPISPIYVKNETGNCVKIIVNFENRFNIQFDSLRYTNKPVEKFKLIIRDSLEGRISVEKSKRDEYRLEIENHKTILLEPRTLGIPIKKIIFQSQLFTDTILNAYRYRPNSYLATKLIIERKGLYTHLIILK